MGLSVRRQSYLTSRARKAGSRFIELRALADALPLLRTVIETRKDQISGLNYTVRSRESFRRERRRRRPHPDRRWPCLGEARPSPFDFATWLRMLIEDMLVIDAA